MTADAAQESTWPEGEMTPGTPIIGGKDSRSNDWETPQYLFDQLDQEFHFTMDVAASVDNAKCSDYLTVNEDGLLSPWSGVCWCNPPYGKYITDWILKAKREIGNGVTTVMLVPASTDTRWFHELIIDRHEIRFIKGRLKFGGQDNDAPFANMIIIFGAL